MRPRIETWCAACRFQLALPHSDPALRQLMLSPERPFEPVTIASDVRSPDGKPHSIRLIPTGADVREPGAYVEFAADHEPFWTYRAWLPVSQLS